MVKRKADPCWVDGPLVREIVEASLVMNVVEESVEEFVADSGAAEKALATSTSDDTVQRLEEAVARGGEVSEVFWLLLELAGITAW